MNNLKNSVHLIGHLGKDPEVRTFEDGRKLAKVTIATKDTYKNANGDKVIETQWHNLAAWGKTAELMEKLLSKGNEIAIQGKLTHRTYEDKEGTTRNFTEIIINEFMKIGVAVRA